MNNKLSRIEFITSVLLFLSVLVIPLSPKWGNITFVAIGLASIYQFFTINKRALRPTLISTLLILIFLVRFIGLIWTSDKQYAFGIIDTALPLLVIPILFIMIPYHNYYSKVIKWAFIIMSVLTMLYAFFQLFLYVSTIDLSLSDYLYQHISRPSDYSVNMLNWKFAHYSFLSLIFIYGFIFLLYLDLDLNRWMSIIVKMSYLILMLLFMTFTGARSGVLLTVIVIGLKSLIFLYEKINLRSFFILTALLFLTTTAAISYYISSKRYSENDYTRYQYAVVAIAAWKESPWIGLGTGSSKAVMRNIDFVKSLGFVETSRYNDHPAISHPHNQYLNELLQFGIIGSIPLFLLVIWMLYASSKARQWDFFLVMVTASIFMLIEAPLNSNKGVVPFTLISCVMAQQLKNLVNKN